MSFTGWTGLPPDEVSWTDGPLEWSGLVPVGPTDQDTDGDGDPDTVLVQADGGMSLFTDLDGDGFADQRVSITDHPSADGTGWHLLDELTDLILGR